MTLARRLDRLERNLLINGGMQLFQRNSGVVTLGLSDAYVGPDRWRLWYANNGSAPTSTVATDVPSYRTKRSLKFAINASNANAQLYMQQRIEALSAMDVANETVSFSIKVKSGSARAITLSLAYASAENNWTTRPQFYSITKTITNNATWQTVTFENIAVPVLAVNGIAVTVMLSDFGVLGTSQDHCVGEAILNSGVFASDFSWAGGGAIADALLAKRFLQIFPAGTQMSAGGFWNTSYQRFEFAFLFPVEMAATPTGSFGTGFVSSLANGASLSLSSTAGTGATVSFSGISPLSGRVNMAMNNNSYASLGGAINLDAQMNLSAEN